MEERRHAENVGVIPQQSLEPSLHNIQILNNKVALIYRHYITILFLLLNLVTIPELLLAHQFQTFHNLF